MTSKLLGKLKVTTLTLLVVASLTLASCGGSIEKVYTFDSPSYAFVDKSGNLKYWPRNFKPLTEYREGVAAIQQWTTADGDTFCGAGGAGFIGLDLVPHLLPFRFSHYSYLSNGLALVRDPRTNKFCYINRNGDVKIGETSFRAYVEECRPFSDGLAAVFVPSKSSNEAPPMIPAAVGMTSFRNGLWGFIDESGRFVIPPKFSSVSNFCAGRARVVLPQDPHLIQVIDTKGRTIFLNTHEALSDFSKDGYAVFSDGTAGKGPNDGLLDVDGTISVDGVSFVNFSDGMGLTEDSFPTDSRIFLDARGRQALKLSRKRDFSYWRDDVPKFSEGLAAMVNGRYPKSTGKKKNLYAQKTFEIIDKRGATLPILTNGKVITKAFPYSDGYGIIELRNMSTRLERNRNWLF